jgi:hypothetical protein
MTDTAHRAAASRHIRKQQQENWLDQLRADLKKSETRSALIRLAHSSAQLYAAGVRKGVEWGDLSPLVLTITCLETVKKGEF